MDSEQPVIESRPRRLLAYLRYNGGRIVADVALLLGWMFVASATFDWLEQPSWLLYVVIFSGVVLYTRVTPTWERPYRSPD
ncbi:hypothetical protein Halru_2561 [Halovivax ruber XH-70]|uniref:DUF8119 domain-containing protein n=1 Tax=Halovivax ruber (strain DSM 18193 / JCM 13892 / XH-70) TaxID=797302 RepID=L0IGM8_HALRX|nr:hypothetical protein [Halovivax ruber]AGB17142.1 hypothetical protein Halru_2561 [Halovivax ruber XH-70]